MSYISPALRQLVTERAYGRCEYCHFPQEAALLAFEMEHIIAEKHGGASEAQNLALACPYLIERKVRTSVLWIRRQDH
jgi:5-methylcytosine-specific restriction endonuclease McrA